MNKKRLSVVMAGAMLASSVAPVLAADAEVSKVEMEKGVLIAELAQKIWEAPRFSKVDDGTVKSGFEGKSVYSIKIGDTEPTVIAESEEGPYTKADLQAKIKTLLADVKVGDVVKLVDLGHTTKEIEKDGEKKTLVLSTDETTTYSLSELANTGSEIQTEIGKLEALNDAYDSLITSHGYDSDKGYVIKLASVAEAAYGKKELVLTTKSKRLDFTHYIDKTTNKPVEITNTALTTTNFKCFAEAAPKNDDIPTKTVTEYTVAADGVGFELSDLYDGLFLTTKGQELLDAAKEATVVLGDKTVVDNNNSNDDDATALVRFVDANEHPTEGVTDTNSDTDVPSTLTPDKNGVYKVKIGIANAYKLADKIAKDVAGEWKVAATDYDEYIISSKSSKELQKILEWINAADAKVDRVVGADRYATAVKLAKEADLVSLASKTGTTKKNIVLVNGNSLVDGLAAAPLASKLAGDTGNAPILLTEANSLPTATKRYLKELIDTQKNKDITVNIVGGDGVVSKSIERELKALNLKVERFGGEDREETSMAVAEEVGFENGAFVVGATGEADAMSISGKAAELKAPVVVSGFEGLSEETLSELEDARVTVLGGDSSVSVAEFEKIESVAEIARRISGSDRKATNAAIINTFYKNELSADDEKAVLVAKDDVLVDALAAANLAAKQHAPIVLATNELSKEQLGAIVLNAKQAKKVYQIGGGVAEPVVRAIAEALNFI